MAGIISVETLRSERVELQPRTSDPSSTEEGECWVRSDLAPETDQIATCRVDTGGSTIDVPVFASGTSQDDVVEAIRLQVGGATGYIPAIPESKAGFPELRIQHNGQVYGYHNAVGETAFFDVAIDGTNSPVGDGETLTVDYSVNNTGGSLDTTQDIRLEVGPSERDRDSDVTVASGASTTGQLSWASASEGDYTASVLSDDDSASTSVSVEPPIPDSRVARYTLDSANISSGTVTDVWKNNDITLNGGTTGQPGLSTQYDSGDSVQFDGNADYLESSNALLDGLNSWSIALWADYDGSAKGWLMCQKDDLNNFGIFNNTPRNNLEIFYAGGKQIVVNENVSSTGEHIVVTYDGSTLELYRDSSGGNTSSVSSSMSNSTGFYYAVRSGLVEYHDGNEDDIRLYDKTLTSTEVSNLYNTGSING